MPLSVTAQGDGVLLTIRGSWTAAAAAELLKAVDEATLPPGTLDLQDQSDSIDLTGAFLLRRLERRAEALGVTPRWAGARPELLRFTDTLNAEREGAVPEPAREPTVGVTLPLDRLGRWAVQGGEAVRNVVDFLGRLYAVIGGALRRPSGLRPRSIVRQVHETGLLAFPIVALIAFLISVIVAYIGAQELRQFGAQPFVVDLVTTSVLRELGVLLTAIIVAGRSEIGRAHV